MSGPKSPQEALRIQRVLIATLGASIAVVVVLAGVVIFSPSAMSWSLKAGMLGMIGMFCLLLAALVPPARAAADNFRRHSAGEAAHHCQCRECGRTFTPARGAPMGPPHALASPQQRGATARSMMRMSPFAGLVLLLALLSAVVIEAFGWGGQTGALALVYTAALVIVNAVGLMIVVLVARAQRNAMDREIARYSPQHGCTCSWCGRRNTVPFPTGREPYSV